MNFHVMTLFPDMVSGVMETSIIGRAAVKGLININTYDIRDYTLDRHKKVDDYPYGGGAGMLMQPQPVYDCYKAVKSGIVGNPFGVSPIFKTGNMDGKAGSRRASFRES